MWKKAALILLIVITGASVSNLSGCDKKERSLLVYAGKGLRIAMEDVKQAFEQKHGIRVNIIYAGSNTLLSTIQKTKKGDVFVPGSLAYIKEAGDLVAHSQYIALHIPAFSVRTDNPKAIRSFNDLLPAGIRIAVGNKDMCAVGKVAEKIISDAGEEAEFAKNIVVTASTVNELIKLVIQKEVDAALIWKDMLEWPEAKELKMIEIPSAINRANEIHAAVLTTSTDRKSADLFVDFIANEGKILFKKHGFEEKM